MSLLDLIHRKLRVLAEVFWSRNQIFFIDLKLWVNGVKELWVELRQRDDAMDLDKFED